MLANQSGQRIECLGRVRIAVWRKRRPASTHPEIVEDATTKSRGVKYTVQVRSPHQAVGRNSSIKAVSSPSAFADDPESGLRALSALSLPHVNFVTDHFILMVKGQGSDLLCGLFRLNRRCALQQTQPFHGSCTRFNLQGIKQLSTEHLIATATSASG